MEKEGILKQVISQIDDFRIVRNGPLVESVNKLNQVFHFIDLSYTRVDIFYHGWVGYRTTEQMKSVIEGHCMKLFQESKCKKMLIENSRMSGSFNDINNWYALEIMPKLFKLGLKHIAVVLPQNIFAQVAVKDWSNKIKGFNNGNFESLSEALNWISVL